MRKWLTLIALAGGLLACSDEQPVELGEQSEAEAEAEALPQITSTEDAGVPQFQIFGGSAKVSNVGAACTADSECKGSAPRCITSIPLINTPLQGGKCTASCARDSECGAKGGCPLAQIANLAKTFLPDAGALVGGLSICLPKCTTDADCSPDLPCQTLPIPSIPFLLTAPTSKFCLPPLPKVVDGGILLPDGGFVGVPDGGLRLPDGGIPSFPGLPGGGGFPGIPGISGFPGLPGAAGN